MFCHIAPHTPYSLIASYSAAPCPLAGLSFPEEEEGQQKVGGKGQEMEGVENLCGCHVMTVC